MSTKSKYITNPAENVLHISENMTGKMSGILSISTLCLNNPRCIARMKSGENVCAHCFAAVTTSRYKALRENCAENTDNLSAGLIPGANLPHFKKTVALVRFESFGDLVNVAHARNYIRIAKLNPHVHFALWTKNPDILAEAIAIDGKPENLMTIQSSLKLDTPEQPAGDFIDKVFTVYRPETIDAEKININCGARDCASCAECYLDKAVKEIREKLK